MAGASSSDEINSSFESNEKTESNEIIDDILEQIKAFDLPELENLFNKISIRIEKKKEAIQPMDPILSRFLNEVSKTSKELISELRKGTNSAWLVEVCKFWIVLVFALLV